MDFKSRHGHTWVTTDQQSQFYVKGLGGWVHAQAQKKISKVIHKKSISRQVQKNLTSPTSGGLGPCSCTKKNLKSQHDMAILSHDTEYYRHFFF